MDAPSIFMIATPIGNLQDFSPRAVETLEKVAKVYCEDTRVSLKLLSHFGISKSLARLDDHATSKEIASQFKKHWDAGESIAYLTDSGTPGVSDPGKRVVEEARKLGFKVSPIPGASALAAFLSVSGFAAPLTVFGGFFPRKDEDRERVLDGLHNFCVKDGASVGIFFESPERIESSLIFLNKTHPHVSLCVAKELTKIHEHVFWGAPQEVLSQIQAQTLIKGEWVFAIEMKDLGAESAENTDKKKQWQTLLKTLIDEGLTSKTATKIVCQVFGENKNDVYKVALILKNSK